MKFKLHNKIEIKTNDKIYTYYNTMLKSVREPLKNLSPYTKFLSFGTGQNNEINSNFKLNNYVASYPLTTDIIQNNPDNGELYIKKYVVISDNKLDGLNLTEAGISSEFNNNPTVYNYFSFADSNGLNGIVKHAGEELVISIYIYLNLSTTSQTKLTLGDNKFIKFLLGEGIGENNFYIARGRNLTDNKSIYREELNTKDKYLCEINFTEEETFLAINFSADLSFGETNEIVFLIGESPFARVNTREFNHTSNEQITITAKKHNVLDLGNNIKSISSLTHKSSGKVETNYFSSKYGISFADKISLPFENQFNYETPRFLSKDGKMIFFVLSDKIFGYENINYEVKPIKIESTLTNNISKIVAFENYIFVITKSKPYISCFIKTADMFEYYSLNLEGFDGKQDLMENIYDAEITIGRNNLIMIGIIENETKNAFSLYFNVNTASKQLDFKSYLTSNREYTYVFSMLRNNFSDSMIFYIKVSDESLYTRIIYYYPDETVEDIYTTLAWHYIENAREIYIKNRAVVVERTTNPSMWIYFYPTLQTYTLSLFGEEENNYISNNLLYLIQKVGKSNYKIYSLVGYNTPKEFDGGFPAEINQSKILDFEFLNDSLLIFVDDEKQPIIAYHFYENSLVLENVEYSEEEYIASVEKYNPLGSTKEGVTVKFTVNILI